MRVLSPFTFLVVLGALLASAFAAEPVARYNVIWDRPSEDATGQMPLGNGDIAAGAYVVEDGDLYLLLAKNDAFNYNGDIYKTGRVRISLNPNPFAKGKPFRQTLDLPTGSIRIEAGGVSLHLWADANRPVYHVQINSPQEVSVEAAPEFWKRFDDCRSNTSREPIDDATQDVRLERDGQILWYFSVGDRSVFPTEMEYCDVEPVISEYPDPYRWNTFGNLLECQQLELENGTLNGKGAGFDIRIHALTEQTPEISAWIDAIQLQTAEAQERLSHRFRHASPQCRFPLYGSAGPDSCPDFDHFGSGSTALQRMLVQEAEEKILLLPAWPADWDVDFKLHLSGKTVIRGKVVDGKLADWGIEPQERKKDVVVYQPQPVPERGQALIRKRPQRDNHETSETHEESKNQRIKEEVNTKA